MMATPFPLNSRIRVRYPPSDVIEHGDWDGRVLAAAGPRRTVLFTYKPTDRPPQETVILNLRTHRDETWAAPISSVRRLGGRRRR
jgi:hypothetical protein